MLWGIIRRLDKSRWWGGGVHITHMSYSYNDFSDKFVVTETIIP